MNEPGPDLSSTTTIEFRPERLSRRGELFAWAMTALLVAAWAFLRWSQAPVHPALPVLTIFLLFTALSISLGNWMDRRTWIQLDADGITYENGLRHARMMWNEIRRVEVVPSGWGKKVRVIGTKAYFAFRTLGEVKVQGEVKGRMGFAEGDLILRRLVESAELHTAHRTDFGYTYARE